MPVLIEGAELERWLSPEPLAKDELERLTRPAPAGALEAFAVSTLVNDARADGPELLAPLEGEEGPAQLF
jgi:putative SOS response-associated peptidase YedK